MKKCVVFIGMSAFHLQAVGASDAITTNEHPVDTSKTQRPNVLFVISDDLNMRIGCFGDPVAKTPHIDRLARMGVRFEQAYCQFPMCNPSRASVMSGRYPTSTGCLDLNTWLVLDEGQQTMDKFFESHGYAVELYGKVFHGQNVGFGPNEPRPKSNYSTPEERALQEANDPVYWDTHLSPYRNMKVTNPQNLARYNEFGTLPEPNLGTDAPVANRAVISMRKLAKEGKPFFLAVGFHKPHVPLKAPAKFFDLYDPALMPLPPDFAPAPTGPNDTPPDELRENADLFAARSFTETEAREAMRAYYACISYMDAQLGRVLDELEKLGLAQNTIIVFISDHGFHLSEKGMWAKGTTFEVSAQGPMIIIDPRQKTGGQACRRTVEYLDVYPTLVDLCGLAPANWLEGASLRPLLENPDTPWDRPAFTVQTRGWYIGRSIRTERWRYTEWDEGRRGAMLFDHDRDPNEMQNLANSPEHKEVLEKLQKQLRESSVSQTINTYGTNVKMKGNE